MLRVIHVSDLHFHRNDNDNKGALRLLERIGKSYEFSPSARNHLMITGDVVDDGRPEQYARAREALLPFRGYLLIVPGNHCYGKLGNFYDVRNAQFFDQEFLPSLGVRHKFIDKEPAVDVLDDGRSTKLVAIGLNSNLPTPSTADAARGQVGFAQLKKLDELLATPDYAGAIKLVYLHHRPQRCGWFLELTDSEELMAVVHNRAQVLAFGHSGGAEGAKEPPQAREMHTAPRPFGVKYLLNANSCVETQKFYEIACEGEDVSVTLR
ncbi:MAG TPA: metallophosphoesterase [Polyangia bacterium]|nr:metallophosphoesterase [Polyangia bacterium]